MDYCFHFNLTLERDWQFEQFIGYRRPERESQRVWSLHCFAEMSWVHSNLLTWWPIVICNHAVLYCQRSRGRSSIGTAGNKCRHTSPTVCRLNL